MRVEFSSVSGMNQTIEFVENVIRFGSSFGGLLFFVLGHSEGFIFIVDFGVEVSNLDSLL